jgi:hypothetical protein
VIRFIRAPARRIERFPALHREVIAHNSPTPSCQWCRYTNWIASPTRGSFVAEPSLMPRPCRTQRLSWDRGRAPFCRLSHHLHLHCSKEDNALPRDGHAKPDCLYFGICWQDRDDTVSAPAAWSLTVDHSNRVAPTRAEALTRVGVISGGCGSYGA